MYLKVTVYQTGSNYVFGRRWWPVLWRRESSEYMRGFTLLPSLMPLARMRKVWILRSTGYFQQGWRRRPWSLAVSVAVPGDQVQAQCVCAGLAFYLLSFFPRSFPSFYKWGRQYFGEQEWTLILGKGCRLCLPFHRVELREGGSHEEASLYWLYWCLDCGSLQPLELGKIDFIAYKF